MSNVVLTEVVPGLLINDVVHWRRGDWGCSRCAKVSSRYLPPYYAPDMRLCPTCCEDLQKVFDEHGWPRQG